MANTFSLVASCKLHGLDPEAYLADMVRVFASWPRERYIELAPKYWRATRARLDSIELARPTIAEPTARVLRLKRQAAPRGFGSVQ